MRRVIAVMTMCVAAMACQHPPRQPTSRAPVGGDSDPARPQPAPVAPGTVETNMNATPSRTEPPVPPAKSIGQAMMSGDGTITLDLRAEGPGGTIGDARFVYPPSHKDYQMILKHLGGMKPGETKPVPPFP
jgi:hypothetical protein